MQLSIGLETVTTLVCCLVGTASSYTTPNPSLTSVEIPASRRTFVGNSIAAFAWSTFPQNSLAANINVTPIAHTFITSSSGAKPLRENDSTRFLTNARVVYLFGANADLASTVVDLTIKRKAEQGPGVTPGEIHVTKDGSVQSVAKMASSLPEGDTLIVGPVSSGGVSADGKLVSEAAQALGVFVGGAKSGGVLSVLLDGPKKDLVMEESGYPISTLLWYSVP